MKIAIAQINCMLGDLAGNAAKIADYAQRAKAQGAAILLTPELSLCGYPAEDLLLRDGFYRACDKALAELAKQAQGIVMLVGHPHKIGKKHYNAASILRDGKVAATYHKHSLPNHSVFDEERYFDSGNEALLLEVDGIRFGINICADVWHKPAAARAREAGAEVLLVLNASPYHYDKQTTRYETLRERIGETGMPIVYANMVGGQDELVFDGSSFAMDADGELTHQFAAFDELMGIVEVRGGDLVPGEIQEVLAEEASIYRALCVGVRDYIVKNRFPGVLLGLSGGIDSALTLAVAVDALGADKVLAVMMPSPYTAQISIDDSREMVKLLGVRYEELDIAPTFAALQDTLAPLFKGLPADTTEENLQARIRGNLLMAISNKSGSLVLTTGNKSEMTVGYCTLYGDMAGGFAVLKDVSKQWVYRLSRYRNTLGRVIPERIITRPPSAELKPDQTDQDNLPPYDVLDAIMACYVEQNMSIPQIVAEGYAEADVQRVVKLVRIAEYKRRQAPVGVRITDRGFGKDWRYPITVRYQDDY
ncbi:MAG: NAD+ synthase [Gammaproteobacteria bacterium]|nr:NAD+ synthase [Gammaproteobacteria bacterium]MBU1775733.1 NAD+ synthase [Gammaproteobacteria bacterium]MBU1969360.1 NAD+ synthase [Gammaproteobacteria bacterium]